MTLADRTLERLLEAIPDAAIAVTADGRIAYANSVAELLFGYPPGGLTGRPHDLLVPPAHRPAHARGLVDFFAVPDRRPMAKGREVPGLRADGSEFPAECFLSPLPGEGGPFALAVVRDLTGIRQREATLREDEARYRQLFEANPHPMWVYDLETLAFLAVNAAAEHKYGFTRDEFLERTIASIRPGEDVAPLRNNVARVTQGLDTAGLWRHVTKEGTLLDVEIISHTLAWNGRRAELVLAHDVTERVRAERQVQRRTRGLTTLLEVSQSLAATLELGPILQATADGAARLFSLDTAAVYLLHGEEVHLHATAPALPPDFPAVLRQARLAEHPRVRQTIASRAPVLLADTAAAELTPAEQLATRARNLRSILYLPLLAGPEPVGVLIVAAAGEPREFLKAEIDLCRTLANLAALAVTNARLYQAGQACAAELEERAAERKRAAEEREALQIQLAQAQKLEAVGRLAGGVAHDFNNMLAVILGRADLALGRAAPKNPLCRDLEEIRQAAERSAELTRQLLAFARRQAVSPRVLDLNEVVGTTLQMLRRLIGEDIELIWAPDPAVGNVRLDPSQLDQLLANLVVNARDAIPGTGRITLATHPVVLDRSRGARGETVAPGAYALLTVRDDGCGMDEATLRHLFEPFFTTKGPGQGTGLGLATVHGIVRQNGGLVEVYSEPGRGTTFSIYLPRAEAGAATTPGADPAAGPPCGSETLLLVEDEPAILDLGREVLEGLGYTVLAAASPAAALHLAQAHRGELHLLVTDVVMPGMNGRELAERLVAARPSLKCLFLSGYTADVIAHRGVLEEGVHFLAKPFTLQDLAAKVRQALARGDAP